MKVNFTGGHDGQFRSQAERLVAEELTRLGVVFEYEKPVRLPDGRSPAYLPDFTIPAGWEAHGTDLSALNLPQWLEVKPQQMLYDLRDLCGVTRRAGEFFTEDVEVSGLTAADLHDRESELAKPKRLAELTGAQVLVVGNVGGTATLSVLFQGDDTVFSRCHPLVNQRGVARAQEKQAQRERWEREAAAREAERQRRQVEADREQMQSVAAQARRRQEFALALMSQPSVEPRYDAPCVRCALPGRTGRVYKQQGYGGWLRVCAPCRTALLGGR